MGFMEMVQVVWARYSGGSVILFTKASVASWSSSCDSKCFFLPRSNPNP